MARKMPTKNRASVERRKKLVIDISLRDLPFIVITLMLFVAVPLAGDMWIGDMLGAAVTASILLALVLAIWYIMRRALYEPGKRP